MKTKLTVFLVTAAAFIATALNGQVVPATSPVLTKAPEPLFTAELTVKVLPRFVDDNAVPTSITTVAQSDLVISHESGLYANVWRSFGLKGERASGGHANETRYFLGWTKDFDNKISLDTGVGYYDLYGKNDDLTTYYVEVSRLFENGGKWKPYITHEAYFTKSAAGYPGGTRTFVGLSYTIELPNVSFEQKAWAMHEHAFGYATAWTYAYEFEAVWKVSDHVSVILPTLRYIAPTSHKDGQERRLIVGIGGKVSF